MSARFQGGHDNEKIRMAHRVSCSRFRRARLCWRLQHPSRASGGLHQDRRHRRGAGGRRLVDPASRPAGGRRDQRRGRRQRPQDRDRHLRQSLVRRESVRAFQRAVERGSRQRRHRQLYQRGRAGARAVDRTPEDGDGYARRRVRRHYAKHRQGLRQSQIHLPRLSDVDQSRRRTSAPPPRTCW